MKNLLKSMLIVGLFALNSSLSGATDLKSLEGTILNQLDKASKDQNEASKNKDYNLKDLNLNLTKLFLVKPSLEKNETLLKIFKKINELSLNDRLTKFSAAYSKYYSPLKMQKMYSSLLNEIFNIDELISLLEKIKTTDPAKIENDESYIIYKDKLKNTSKNVYQLLNIYTFLEEKQIKKINIKIFLDDILNNLPKKQGLTSQDYKAYFTFIKNLLLILPYKNELAGFAEEAYKFNEKYKKLAGGILSGFGLKKPTLPAYTLYLDFGGTEYEAPEISAADLSTNLAQLSIELSALNEFISADSTEQPKNNDKDSSSDSSSDSSLDSSTDDSDSDSNVDSTEGDDDSNTEGDPEPELTTENDDETEEEETEEEEEIEAFPDVPDDLFPS